MDGEAGTATVEHVFFADPWWALCASCGLSEAAHTHSYMQERDELPYRCPFCVDQGKRNCTHKGSPLGMDGGPLGGI
jgi:hypothetical protein